MPSASSPGRGSALTAKRAAELKRRLDPLLQRWPYADRVKSDPVELPHRYRDPRDIEVSALLAASLAYGRVDLFKPKVRALLEAMGPSPSSYVEALDVPRAAKLLEGFVYRFNLPADLAVLLLGMGQALRRHGSLEALFVSKLTPEGGVRAALEGFTTGLRDADRKAIRKVLGPERGLSHLLPSPAGPGASKRLNLYLRWMVRGPDEVDFGIWRKVSPSILVVPLDTHLARMARHLGLTRRKDLTWRTAEEVTASLRLLDAEDPVRYDFVLCHFGMSGACPLKPTRAVCSACELLPVCTDGKRR